MVVSNNSIQRTLCKITGIDWTSSRDCVDSQDTSFLAGKNGTGRGMKSGRHSRYALKLQEMQAAVVLVLSSSDKQQEASREPLSGNSYAIVIYKRH